MSHRPKPDLPAKSAATDASGVTATLTLSRLTAEFARADVEADYRRSFAPEWRRINLVGIIVLAGFMMLVQLSDLFRLSWSSDLALMAVCRVLAICTGIVVAITVWRTRGQRAGDWAVLAFLLTYSVAFVVNTTLRPIPPGQEDPLTYQVLGIALMVAAYLFFNMRFLFSLAAGVTVTLAYDAGAYLNSGLPSPETVIAFALQIVGNLLLAFTVYRVHVLRRRQYANYHAERAARVALAQREADLLAASRDLESARDEAVDATKAKSDFLAQMSHELRSPLNAIIGFADVVKARSLGAADLGPYETYIADISSSANHLLAVINDLLDLSRVEAGRFELENDVFIAADVANGALRMVRDRAKEKTIELAIAALPKNILLTGDERVVRQVLLNLLTNAVKFTPEGGIVSLSSILKPDGSFTIAVSDTGPGIAAEELPRVMELYGRADHARALRAEGTGLGLPLAKMMMELHGGSLTIESQLGRGTVTAMTLPASRVQTKQAA
jgi:signal transduction histidine kinase